MSSSSAPTRGYCESADAAARSWHAVVVKKAKYDELPVPPAADPFWQAIGIDITQANYEADSSFSATVTIALPAVSGVASTTTHRGVVFFCSRSVNIKRLVKAVAALEALRTGQSARVTITLGSALTASVDMRRRNPLLRQIVPLHKQPDPGSPPKS